MGHLLSTHICLLTLPKLRFRKLRASSLICKLASALSHALFFFFFFPETHFLQLSPRTLRLSEASAPVPPPLLWVPRGPHAPCLPQGPQLPYVPPPSPELGEGSRAGCPIELAGGAGPWERTGQPLPQAPRAPRARVRGWLSASVGGRPPPPARA